MRILLASRYSTTYHGGVIGHGQVTAGGVLGNKVLSKLASTEEEAIAGGDVGEACNRARNHFDLSTHRTTVVMFWAESAL